MDGIYQTSSVQAPKPVSTDSYQYTDAVASSAPVTTPSAPVSVPASGLGEGKPAPSDDQVKAAIEKANRKAHFGHTNAQFSYHEATKSISVKIIDQQTNEIIREFPPEETLDMISKMWELAGIIVDEKR
ncbi:MAG: flagellar protein FlaG [Lachnospiraceae bacterium]|nr:flagellar protein FlaG [Lachnospiraceae bacterium]